MILLFCGVRLLFSVFVPNFLSVDNIIRVIQNNAEVAIISIGMTIVMLMGGIDLSVGAVMGVVAVVTGTMIEKQMNTILVYSCRSWHWNTGWCNQWSDHCKTSHPGYAGNSCYW